MCTGGRAGVDGLGFRPFWKANFEYPLLGSCLAPSQKHYCTTVFRYAVPGKGSINIIRSNQRTRSRKILIEMLPPPVRGTSRLGQKWPVALSQPIWNRAIPWQIDKNIFVQIWNPTFFPHCTPSPWKPWAFPLCHTGSYLAWTAPASEAGGQTQGVKAPHGLQGLAGCFPSMEFSM